MKKWLMLLMVLPAFASAQTGSDIFLLDMKVENGQVFLSKPVNITNRPGYDNQPFFHPDKSLIYFSSFNDSGRSDIKFFDYKANHTGSLTETNEREYSPTVTPDKKFISCIIQRDNKAQDLGKYPINGGAPTVLIDNLVVGYHSWIDNNRLLLFVLGDTMTLRLYNLHDKQDKVLAKGIGRSLHKIPGQQAMSFIHKISKDEWLIKKYDIATGNITTITPTLPGREDLAWLKNNMLLMSDGTKLFSFRPGLDSSWVPVVLAEDVSPLKTVTRLAVNPSNNKLAVVVSE